MSSELDLLVKLKTQLVAFFDELINTFPEETDFVIFRIFIKDQIPIEDVMNYIIAKLCPLQSLVKAKNSDFFMKNNILFEKFDKNKLGTINRFRNLWLSDKLDDEDRDVLWKWFDTFITLGNKYSELQKA